MAQINPYLTFNGNCEEAFNFYKSIFGGEFSHIMRFKDMPDAQLADIDESHHEKISNIALPINKQCTLMGSDANPAMGDEVPFGKNITLSVHAETKEEADTFFNALSENGAVFMPISDTFWGAYFGMCEDKYGMNWMVSFDANDKAQS